METNDPQRAKRRDLQGNNDQSFENPHGGVEQGRDVNAPEKAHTQKVCQIDVSESICEERRRQKDKPDFGNRSNCFREPDVGCSGCSP